MRRLAARGIDDHLHTCSTIWFSFLFSRSQDGSGHSHRAPVTGFDSTCPFHLVWNLASPFTIGILVRIYHFLTYRLFSSASPRLLGSHFKQLIIVVAPRSSPISKGTVPLVPKLPGFMALLGYRNPVATQKILQAVIARLEPRC